MVGMEHSHLAHPFVIEEIHNDFLLPFRRLSEPLFRQLLRSTLLLAIRPSLFYLLHHLLIAFMQLHNAIHATFVLICMCDASMEKSHGAKQ